MNAYLCVANPALALLLWLDPGLAILLFIIYPQVWMYCESRRTAVALTVAVTVSAAAGFAAGEGWQPEAVREIGLQMLVSLLFSLLLGLWISGVIEQSKDRAGLIAQLEATRSELAEVNHAQGVTAERERMAREIHDTLAQGFTSVVMLAQAASAGMQRDPAAARARLGTIEDVARENLAEARALVAAFSPVGLDGVTLPDAVLRLAQRFGTETGLVVDVEVAGELAGLGRRREVVLLRAAQEALTNVRRHAQAQQVTVRLVADDEGARVEVDDDGVGFAVSGTTGTGGLGTAAGFGLAGMRGRVHEAGGEVDVASEPGRGTRVTVRVP
jgi:signal transduction histidine kinase